MENCKSTGKEGSGSNDEERTGGLRVRAEDVNTERELR